jgi:hypothetical protein
MTDLPTRIEAGEATDAEVATALAAARMSPAKRAARSEWVRQHIEALKADIARRKAAAAATLTPEGSPPCSK